MLLQIYDKKSAFKRNIQAEKRDFMMPTPFISFVCAAFYRKPQTRNAKIIISKPLQKILISRT